jgi:hypothetical protein
MTFNDLEFVPHEMVQGLTEEQLEHWHTDMRGSKHAKLYLSDGVGVSVVFGKLFYSNGVDTYEAWVYGDNTEILTDCYYDEPKGYLSADEVTAYIHQLEKDINENA